MPCTRRFFNICAALFGFSGVALGAIAAHAIADPHAAARVSTAALYALIHAAVLLGWQGEGRLSVFAKSCLTLGTLLFSGALTLAYLAQIPTPFAPWGGSFLLLGWATMLVATIRDK